VKPNLPTPEGRELGANLARFCDAAEIEKRKAYPNFPKRCGTCAFRLGTIPNGCHETQMDALKCVMERVPFICHEYIAAEPLIVNGRPCAGWAMMRDDSPPVEAFWPFSDEAGAEERIRELVAARRLQ